MKLAATAGAISNDVNLTEMMLVLGLRNRMVGYELPELSAKYPTKEVLALAKPDLLNPGAIFGASRPRDGAGRGLQGASGRGDSGGGPHEPAAHVRL